MLKQIRAVAVALSLSSVAVSSPVLAHHGHDHGPPSPPTPPTTGTPTVAPTAVSAPPPVIQAPPPVVNAAPPAFTLSNINIQMPILAPISTILPTDVSGIHAGPYASQTSDKPLSKDEIAALMKADERYKYTGEWLLFSDDYANAGVENQAAKNSQPQDKIADSKDDNQPKSAEDSNALQKGRVMYVESPSPKVTDPMFMPTENAKYSKVDDEHMALHDGAVLVRAGERPVFVSVTVNGEKNTVRIAGGAFALISAFDSKSVIVNLTDKCCGALILYVPSSEKDKQHSIALKTGQIAEVYAQNKMPPNSNLVASKIDCHRQLESGIGIILSQCHYVRTLKKFNLLSVLGKRDLNRVLKTAAAIAHVRSN